MKSIKLILYAILIAFGFSELSCKDSDSSNTSVNSYEDSSDELERYAGKWFLVKPFGYMNQTNLWITIKSNGDASIKCIHVEGASEQPLMNGSGTAVLDGDVLFIQLSNGDSMELQAVGGEIYTLDGERLTRS